MIIIIFPTFPKKIAFLSIPSVILVLAKMVAYLWSLIYFYYIITNLFHIIMQPIYFHVLFHHLFLVPLTFLLIIMIYLL